MSASTPLLVIRHGKTAWNAEGRVQGFSDIPLSAEGRSQVSNWRLPEEFSGWRWIVSPLSRARETARLLGAPEDALTTERRLIEMHWGAWEGVTMADLAADMDMIRDARRRGGLDFRPPGGESARDVCERLTPWLRELAVRAQPTIAVAHMGVVRALFALATGWDMRAPMERDFDWNAAQLFDVSAGGTVALTRRDIALAPAKTASAP